MKNVVNDLTIDESHRLQKQVQELKGENEYKEYLNQQSLNRIKLENQELREELEKIRKAADFSEIKEQLNEIRQQMRIEKKRDGERNREKIKK